METPKIVKRYFIYCRKSSETEDRQVQSIETQIRELREYAEKNGLEIVDVIYESKSAHHPGRLKFNEMLTRIRKGEANAVLVLFPNRLSRNSMDAGTVIYLMDLEKLLEIRTPAKTYYNTSTDKAFLTIELAFSKKDSDDKGEHVKTGLRTRYLKGYPNGVAPIGFINDLTKEKGNRGWFVDKEKFLLVAQLLKKFNTGRYSAREITRMSWEMGLLTPLHKRQGGKKLGDSYVHGTLLKSPVYAGFFFDKDKVRHELHTDMPRAITEEEYWYNQTLLGNKGRPRPSVNKNSFAYTGVAKCGNCGGSITAEHKYQLICPKCKKKFAYKNKTHCPGCGIAIEKMKGPTYLHYIYNHCSKKKNPDCDEKSVWEGVIDEHMSKYFRDNLCISEGLAKWCSENIKILDNTEEQNEFEKKASIEKVLAAKRNQEKKLILMCAQGTIDEKNLADTRTVLKEDIKILEEELDSMGNVDPAKIQRALKAFEIAVGISKVFENGTVLEKKEALTETGSNLTIKDKKVSVSNAKIYSAIIKGLLEAKAKNPRFEPDKIVDLSSSNSDFSPSITTLLRG